MGIITLVFGLIIALIISYVGYKILEDSGFKKLLIVSWIFYSIVGLIQNHFQNIIFTILYIFIARLIISAIEFLAYEKTNSFLGYFFLTLIIELILGALLAFIVYYVFGQSLSLFSI